MMALWTIIALLGMALNLAFSHVLIQPDWTLAILAGTVLAHRGSWVWVAPLAAMHDLLFFDSLWGLLPVVLVLPLALPYLDFHLGPALPQRFVFMLLSLVPMLMFGVPFVSCVLTAACMLPVWHYMARYYARLA
ncbi:MAG: hypothetical protein D6703_06885 [Zetaproteobacteria bacterium]|nr:MAG: hypothetical protein D6703_06885 [Zetaproteobacteria bacterium]